MVLAAGCGGRPPVQLRLGVVRAAPNPENVDVLWRLAGGSGSMLPHAQGPLARHARVVPGPFESNLGSLADSLQIEWLQQVEPDTLRVGIWAVASGIFEVEAGPGGYLLKVCGDSHWTEFLVAPGRALFVRRPEWDLRGEALFIIPQAPLH